MESVWMTARNELYLVEALKRHQARLAEVLDAIERRDMAQTEVKNYLEWVAKGLGDLRKRVSKNG